MLLLELAMWLIDHWGEISIGGIVGFIAKKLIAYEIKKHLPHHDELTWTRQRVEMLTGEKYGGGTTSWNQARRSLRKWWRSSQEEINQVYQKRRVKDMQKVNWFTLTVAILGAGKLIAQPFGIEISDAVINDIANGVAALITVGGIIYNHAKGDAANAQSNTIASNK